MRSSSFAMILMTGLACSSSGGGTRDGSAIPQGGTGGSPDSSGGTTAPVLSTGVAGQFGGATSNESTLNPVGGRTLIGGTSTLGGSLGGVFARDAAVGNSSPDADVDVSQQHNEAGSLICGDNLCGSGQYCCSSPCMACMPNAASCSSLVCGTGDGGTYPSYPADCHAAYSGDSTFCMMPAMAKHSIHYYQCTTSVLAFPCLRLSNSTSTGGGFCCPGDYY